jgi:cytidylate kinase
MSKEPNYEHADIFWVGGPAAAGKTTVSRLLARKHGFLWYSVDAYAFAHEKRAVEAGLHVMGTGPGDFDRKPMIMEDIQSLAVDTSVVVEGAFVTPGMAGVSENAVWLMPSKEEQLVRLERRNPGGVHKDYVWGRDLVRSQLEGTSASVVVVDGQTVEQSLLAVEQRFGAILGSCPAARTIDDRQSLIRISNRQLAEQAAEMLRLQRNKENGHHAVRVFDCECAQANCNEVVELAVEDMPTVLAQAPPSIVSPEHSNLT